MKKLLLLAICTVSLSADALPTYEPFTEFASTIASNPTNLLATTNGVSLGTNANYALSTAANAVFTGITNCIDLATGGYTAPGGEQWGNLNFSGTAGTGIHGVDIAVVSNNTIFTYSALSSLLPPAFPGLPASGQAITNIVLNPAQPSIWNGTAFAASANVVGNSAVLKFSQDITRPTSGTKTLFVSYLLSVAQQGQLGAGNDGRYMAFLSQSNLVEPSASYASWSSLFNTFNGDVSSGIHYGSHSIIQKTVNSTYYIGACDSAAGKDFGSSTFSASFNAPAFVVGVYVLNSGTNWDTNAVWVNPATSSFGGQTPPLSPIQVFTVSNSYMTDLGGLVLIDRVGSGALGGVGTNYIANLLVGSTWSYVTGGPEFTTQPANFSFLGGLGGNATFAAAAVAAGQSVTYQWQVITGGSTNNLGNGNTNSSVTATVAGSQTATLTLTGIGSGDLANTYQCVATASGTSYALPSSAVSLIQLTDPFISSQPQPIAVTTNYGSTVTFTATASTGQTSMTYGWSLNGIPLANGLQSDGICTASGATGSVAATNLTATLTLSSVTYRENGDYTLSVTNNLNSTISSASHASLTVNDPVIATQPNTNITVVSSGGSVNFSVTAQGTAPLAYQWYGQLQGQLSDGSTFTGSTNSTLMIANAQPVNSDNYYVIVTGPGGSVQSSNAIIYVNAPVRGPFSTNAWPGTIAPNAVVDYHVVDPNLASTLSAQAPASWNNNMLLAPNSADETYTATTLDGLQSDVATGTYWNWADPLWQRFVNVPQIDILLLVYGNSDLYDNTNGALPTTYSYGVVNSSPATTTYEHAGFFPLGANNGQWNWILLSVTNVVDVNGYRTIGDPVAGAGVTYGGINGGTIRLEGFAEGMAVAAYAFGPSGAFGSSNSINRFANPVSCALEPTNNLAYIDFNQGVTNNLIVMNNLGLGETYTVASGVGPANDLRTAIQPSGQAEVSILNDFLGLPCNEDLSMQLCMEVYDDPALAGSQFGPYQYATDSQGDLQTYLGQFYTLTGSGQWLKVAFYFGPANLQGVNSAPLTGGPTISFFGTPPYIDRMELGVIRTGTNALAGQIPDPSYYLAPLVTCSNGYGYYAEWYPSHGITNNVGIPATYAAVTGIGPANDQRIAETPNPVGVGSACYEQFALLNNVFGPVYQDNADVIVSVDYYDDPALTNNDLYPNTYNTLNNGVQTVLSPQSPYGTPVYLAGTGKWQTATWELPNVSFYGAYVCRFASSAPIYISRVRFNVIRPCGSYEGIDYLQSPVLTATNRQINVNWRGQASVQSAPAVVGAYSNILTITNTGTNVYNITAPMMTNRAQFFRLSLPGYPTNLAPNGP